jgi:4-hydroxy-tetrahydrodipicolinate synthase
MFTGCGTALVTPFRKDLSLDEETLRRLVRRQIEAGIDFLVPCGTTGENPTLTRAEHLRVVEITLEEAKGKVPVLAGAGGYNTAEVIELAKELQALGADGLLSVTPYYNKPTQEGLYQHYKAIASTVRLPIIVYSVQGRTGVNVEPATLKRLAANRLSFRHSTVLIQVNGRREGNPGRHRQQQRNTSGPTGLRVQPIDVDGTRP